VDVHVHRIANRLRWVTATDGPEATRRVRVKESECVSVRVCERERDRK
jgi:endonuclease III